MKKPLQFLLFLFLCLSAFYGVAQCNVNDKYDKIISGYHSSIALKDNGVYAVWGSYMKNAGNADQLAPQDLVFANYPLLTSTASIYKAALGGKNAGAQVDQAFVLTSDGLFAWGVAGNVVSTTVKSTNTFGRTSTTSANGFNTYGLPSTITPLQVASLFATYQTLVLLTTGGDVWILTQTTQAVEGNNSITPTAAATATWKQIKTTGGANLTNVKAVRGQVSNSTYNAFIALTTTGQVYTWGNSTYLGDGSAAVARSGATLMSIPSEFSSSIPNMIGVTGGIGTTTTTKNTYYLLSNAGNLYSLGDNTQRQCGDFTTVEKTSWVNVKKSAAAGDNLTGISFFSCQEHNCSYPAVAAISGGSLYTWGNNSSGMVGRTDNGLAAGGLTTPSFDPGVPVGFVGTAVSVEMGGHTMVYLKEGSSQFCYVGHYTNGSMGDGTSGNNGSSSATSLKHDCTSTPVLSICGSVAVAANVNNSTIAASLPSIPADGSSVSVITIQLKDASGVNLIASGGTVTVTTSAGALGTVTDNNNGTYTAVLTSSTSVATATVGFAVNGSTSTSTTPVHFATVLPLTWLQVSAYRQDKTVKIAWTTTSEMNVKNYIIERSENGTSWETVVAGIAALNGSGDNNYHYADNNFNPKQLFYRIKQVDMDGRYTYSSIQVVLADHGKNNVTVYPVPAGDNFYLGNIINSQVKKVELISVNGAILKSWNGLSTVFSIGEFPTGVYIVRVEKNDGNIDILKLTKR